MTAEDVKSNDRYNEMKAELKRTDCELFGSCYVNLLTVYIIYEPYLFQYKCGKIFLSASVKCETSRLFFGIF